MLRTSKFLIVLVLLVQLVSPSVFGQDVAPSPSGTRKQMATIVFSGLAGAVLGLSTLSFYGRPQDRLSNIAIGFAIGIVSGAVLVTYGATTDPDQFYGRELSAYNSGLNFRPAADLNQITRLRPQAIEFNLPIYSLKF